MKSRNILNSNLKAALAAVKYSHDPVAAKNLIEYFYEHIHNGNSYNESVLHEFLEHAFGKIVKNGWSADHAFGFKLRRGKYEREGTTERDITATAHMILLMRNGWTWQAAIGEVANSLFSDGKGDKAIEAAYAHNNSALQQMTSDFLMELLPPNTPIITRDKDG